MTETAKLIESVLAAFARRDAEGMIALTTPDVIVEPATTEIAERRPYHGADGIRTYLADLDRDWDEFSMSQVGLQENPPYAVSLLRIYARAAGTIADNPGALAWRIEDGRVAWVKLFHDRAEALSAAGL